MGREHTTLSQNYLDNKQTIEGPGLVLSSSAIFETVRAIETILIMNLVHYSTGRMREPNGIWSRMPCDGLLGGIRATSCSDYSRELSDD